MNKLRRLRSLSPEMAETLRLAGVQGIFWAAMAVGNYQTVYLQSIGFPATDFGLLNAIACAVAIFAMTFWGTVSDRIGSVRKIVILTLTLGCGLFIFVPLIPTGQSYSTLLFLILIPIINFFRVPMSPFVDNLTVRNCAEHRLNYGMIRSSGSLLFAIAGVITVNALIPAAGVPSTFWVMGIVMIPAIVLTYFCFEPQSGKRVKKSAAGTGVLLKNYAYMAFLIFAFFFQMAAAFEGNFLTYYMADIQIDTVNLGLILSVRAMRARYDGNPVSVLHRPPAPLYQDEIPHHAFCNFDGDGVSVLLLPCEFAADYVGICRVLRPWQRCISRHGHELYL